MSRHTLSVLVEDKPGVLARVASLFSRRGFNIESLAVGPTELPEVSRMTIVVTVESLPLEQVTKQLNKLINVLKIVELDEATAVERELMLIKVKGSHRTEVLQLNAQVVDVATEHGEQIVSVRFWGLIREQSDQAAADFDEIWHLVRAPGGEALRNWIDNAPNQLYAALCFQGGAAFRKKLLDDNCSISLIETLS